jgi:hypothetical protein
MIRHKSVAKNVIVIVIDAVIVIETVIVDVHVHGNETVIVIRPVDGVSQESPTTPSITSTVGFTFTCTDVHGYDHGPDHVNDHAHVNDSRVIYRIVGRPRTCDESREREPALAFAPAAPHS